MAACWIFAQYRGRVLLVVNTASFCGFAPQFRPLEALNKTRASGRADGNRDAQQ